MPAALAFGNQQINASSPELNVVLGNTGNGPLTVASATGNRIFPMLVHWHGRVQGDLEELLMKELRDLLSTYIWETQLQKMNQ